MSLTKRAGLLAGAAALTLTGGSLADTTQEANTTELKARIAELESRLAAVEAKDGDQLTEQRAAEVRAIVEDALADADTRASMLNQGMTAGYDDGFVISSTDGNWLLRTNFLMQQRFQFGYAEANAAGTDGVWGFENTRSTFTLSGNVVSPEWFYKIEINVGSNLGGSLFGEPSINPANGVPPDVRVGTLDAYAGYDFGNGFRIYAGQFKSPFLREEMIDSQYQLAVERSLLNYIFTAGRTDGIMVEYTTDNWRAMGSYNDGMRAHGFSGLLTSPQSTRAAFSGRFEYLVMGTWDQMRDFSSLPGEETGVLVGGALLGQRSQDQVAGVADTAYYGATVDAQAEFGGANLYGALIVERVDNGGNTPDQDAWGFLLQGGYMFMETWEGFGRFEYIEPDSAATTEASIVTAGVTKYFEGHNAKWTTDVGFALDEIAATAGVTGWRLDTPGSDGQFVVRTQLQIAF
jgi:hypothetical protein